MTSFPAAIPYALQAVQSILNGSVLPDKLVLYLTFAQFGDNGLPQELLALADRSPVFEIRNYDRDIRSYRKLIPALQDFPEAVIVTVDDDVILQEPGNVFMPMTWRSGLEIQAWSQNGYTDRGWKLPKEWEGVESVDIYDLSLEGLRYLDTAEVSGREFTMSLEADQSAVIVPAGANPNSTETFDQNGTVQFLGRDTETDGNWTAAYGTEGYELFDGTLGENMPEGVQISYVNGTVETMENPESTETTEIVENTGAPAEDAEGALEGDYAAESEEEEKN